MRAWFLDGALPLEDFAGYVAAIEQLRDALLRHGRVPLWCAECFGGTTQFWGVLKETLALPLSLALDGVLATKLAFLLAKLAAAAGLYAVVVRCFGSRPAGLLAGYAYGFGACANHETAHLDVPISLALFPLFFLSALETLRRASLPAALALGLLTSALLANSFVQVWLAPVSFALLLWLRPWRADPGDANPWRERRLAVRWTALAGAALAVFLLASASQLAWLVADSGNHAFFAREELEAGQQLFVERSPFLYLNRDNLLAPWLRTHGAPGVDIAQVDAGRRYLGAVVLAVCAVGWLAVRRHFGWRRWYQAALLLFLICYGLALGPHTLLGQLARAFGWSPQLEARVRALALAGAALAAAAGLVLCLRRRRRGVTAVAPPVELAFGLALGLAFPCLSLWSALRAALPFFAMQRSPGHFFDVAPFALYLLFALSATALLHPLRSRALAGALWLALGALVVVDFWPSARAFSEGTPLAPLRELRRVLALLPDEGGTLRIATAPINSGLQTWLATGSGLGLAWSWVDWQAGRHWPDFMRAAAWDLRPTSAPAVVRDAPSDTALLAAGRIRYFLLDGLDPRTQGLELPAPWSLRANDGRFSLWEQPDVAPVASAHRAWLELAGVSDADAARAAAPAFRAGALVVSADAGEAGARSQRRLARRDGGWQATPCADALCAPQTLQHTPVLPVAYRRWAPERISLELDAGAQPALVFVSEGYHPWWRARVDGEPAPLRRAQLAFLAVPVPPGAHRVELRLERPLVVAAADWTSRIFLLALAGYGLWRVAASRRARRRG